MLFKIKKIWFIMKIFKCSFSFFLIFSLTGVVTILLQKPKKAFMNILTTQEEVLVYGKANHFIVIVVEGRTYISKGMDLHEYAAEFLKRGCSTAYNLDGGGSSVIIFKESY